MTQQEVNEIIELHELWLTGKEGGKRANFQRCKFSGIDFSDKNLSGADFSYSTFTSVSFYRTNLSRADFSHSQLYQSDFRGVDFFGVNLKRAELVDTKFARSNIFRFNKEGGRDCFAVVHDSWIMIHAGCFWGSLDEFQKKATKKKAGYEAQIVYLRALEKMYCKQ